jgi:hypothetical protein
MRPAAALVVLVNDSVSLAASDHCPVDHEREWPCDGGDVAPTEGRRDGHPRHLANDAAGQTVVRRGRGEPVEGLLGVSSVIVGHDPRVSSPSSRMTLPALGYRSPRAMRLRDEQVKLYGK